MRNQQRVLIWAFLLPTSALYALFVLYPIFSAFYTSMFNWRGIGKMTWAGFANYSRLLGDENFLNALKNTGKYMLFQVPVILLLAILFTMVIVNSKKSRLIEFYRTSLFLPYVLPAVAVAMLWSAVLNPVTGLLNNFLEAVGLGFLALEWLAEAGTAFGSLIWVQTWSAIGFYTVLLLAGVSNISEEVLEAAEVDGANWLQRSFLIIIPMLSDVMKVVVVFVLLNSLKLFAAPQLMTNGGPYRSTEPISLYIYEQAFQDYNFGYASAIGVVFFLMILLLTILTLQLMGGGNENG
ncbi:MAG: sugar ABC transporter permease [Firmicutes bacterium]|nr:sugar ABC transporter permease [Bacillota bacterium]